MDICALDSEFQKMLVWTPTCCVRLNHNTDMQWASQSQTPSYVNQRDRKLRHVGSPPPCLSALRKLRARRPSLDTIFTSSEEYESEIFSIYFGCRRFSASRRHSPELIIYLTTEPVVFIEKIACCDAFRFRVSYFCLGRCLYVTMFVWIT